MAKWYSFSAVLAAQIVVGLSPGPNLHQCLWTPCKCGSKRLSCHAHLCTLSRCYTRGESFDRTGKKACKKGSTLTLKLRTDITRGSKQGYQLPYKKDLYPQKILKKNGKNYFWISQNWMFFRQSVQSATYYEVFSTNTTAVKENYQNDKSSVRTYLIGKVIARKDKHCISWTTKSSP